MSESLAAKGFKYKTGFALWATVGDYPHGYEAVREGKFVWLVTRRCYLPEFEHIEEMRIAYERMSAHFSAVAPTQDIRFYELSLWPYQDPAVEAQNSKPS